MHPGGVHGAPTGEPSRARWLVPVVVLGPVQGLALIVLALVGDAGYIANFVVINVVIAFSLPVLAGAILARHRTHVVGWLLLWTGLVAPVQLLSGLVATELVAPTDLVGELPPLLAVMITLPTWMWVPAVIPFMTLLVLHFPDGQLPSPRWRAFRAWCVVAIAVLTVAFLSLTPVFSSVVDVTVEQLNAGTELATPRVAEVLAGIGFPMLLVALVGCLASVVVRYRQATTVVRLQLRWVMAAAGVGLPLLVGGITADQYSDNPIVFVAMTVGVVPIPAAMAVAILRFRLYDLERLVSRVVSWILLSAVLILLYVAAVLVLSTVLQQRADDPPSWVVAVATLLAAAVFSPLRRSLQALIDRRLYRSRSDARHTVATLGLRLRDNLDVGTVGDEVTDTVVRSLQPSTVALWLDTS